MDILSKITDPIANYYEGKARVRGATKGGAIQKTALDKLTQDAGKQYTEIAQEYDPYIALGQDGATRMQQLLDEDYNVDPFQYDKNINEFLDPSMDFRRQQGTMARDQSAAVRGGLFDSGYQKDLENYAQDLASTEYANSFDRLQKDKGTELDIWNKQLEQMRLNRQQRMTGIQELMSQGQYGTTGKTGAMGTRNQITNEAGLNSANIDAQIAAMREQQDASFGTNAIRAVGGIGDAGITGYSMGAFDGLSGLFDSSSPTSTAGSMGASAVGGTVPNPNLIGSTVTGGTQKPLMQTGAFTPSFVNSLTGSENMGGYTPQSSYTPSYQQPRVRF